MLNREVFTQVVIDAPPEQVWLVLTDFARYPEWNPFLTAISGAAEKGARLAVRIALPGTRAKRFLPKVIRLDPARQLRWLGHLLLPGVLDGEHGFVLEPMEDGRTRFVQCEQFRGLLVPLLWPSLKKRVRRGFLLMNAALKSRVEGLAREA